MTIRIEKRIRILKRMFERSRLKNLYVTTLYVTGKIFLTISSGIQSNDKQNKQKLIFLLIGRDDK